MKVFFSTLALVVSIATLVQAEFVDLGSKFTCRGEFSYSGKTKLVTITEITSAGVPNGLVRVSQYSYPPGAMMGEEALVSQCDYKVLSVKNYNGAFSGQNITLETHDGSEFAVIVNNVDYIPHGKRNVDFNNLGQASGTQYSLIVRKKGENYSKQIIPGVVCKHE